jgi:hypothetical protein
MCYEFESWSWKARAKAFRDAHLKTNPIEQKPAPAQPVEVVERKRGEVKTPEKMPA